MKCNHIVAGVTFASVLAMQAVLWAAEGPADPGAPVAPPASYSDVFSGYQTFVSESGGVANPGSGLTSAGHQMQGMQGMHNMPGMGGMKGMKGMKGMSPIENMGDMEDARESKSNKSKKGGMKNMPEMENMPGMDHGQMQHMQH